MGRHASEFQPTLVEPPILSIHGRDPDQLIDVIGQYLEAFIRLGSLGFGELSLGDVHAVEDDTLDLTVRPTDRPYRDCEVHHGTVLSYTRDLRRGKRAAGQHMFEFLLLKNAIGG